MLRDLTGAGTYSSIGIGLVLILISFGLPNLSFILVINGIVHGITDVEQLGGIVN